MGWAVSHLSLAAVVADIDQVGLRDNLAVSAVSAAQADAGADDVCRKRTVQINLGRSDVAMAKAHCVELCHRNAGGEVYIKRGNVALLIGVKAIHCGTNTTGIWSITFANGVILIDLAGETGVGIHPICFEEHLLSESSSHTHLLQVEISYICFAPVILHIAGDDNSLAPAIGNAIGLAGGHLDNQLIGGGLMPYSG